MCSSDLWQICIWVCVYHCFKGTCCFVSWELKLLQKVFCTFTKLIAFETQFTNEGNIYLFHIEQVHAPHSHQLCGGWGFMPGESMWDLWWTAWNYEHVCVKVLGVLLSFSFYQCSIYFIIYQ
jgi:hypothetical protein